MITGIPYNAAQITDLLRAPQTHVLSTTPLTILHAQSVSLSEKTVLYFSTDKSTSHTHQTSEGRCVQRKDLATVPVSASVLQMERQEQLSREYDRGFVDGAEATHLNLNLLQAVSNHMHGMTPEKTLQYLGLADYAAGRLRLRRAALLLFAKDISKWHPKCSVRIMVINGTEFKTGRDYNVRTDEQVEGNILTLMNKAWEQWRPHLVRTALDDGRFTDKVAYPDDACREALVNALTHRDYSMEGKGVEIRVFDDRMEIRSPGTLLSTITFDQLNRQTGGHDSRNAYIARVLREAGYVREMGEGIQRIFSLMSASELTAPQFEPKDGNFCVTLSHGSIFSEKDLAWLGGYRKLNLTSDEKLVVMLGRSGDHLSSQLIFDGCGSFS